MKLILCIHLPSISLYKTVVCCSSQIRTLVATATFSFHRLIMGKVKILYFCSLIGDIGVLFCITVYRVVYVADEFHPNPLL